MSDYERYAIYFAPERESALARFGNAWLGFDPDGGAEIERPNFDGISAAQISRLTDTPSRYGFHGTLKPPFYLSQGKTFEDLDQAIENLSGDLSPFEIRPLGIHNIGDFLALTPIESDPVVNRLASTCVVELDGFRAEPCEKELIRRHTSGLTPLQTQLLQQWGYPYVMTEFRFHLTLSGKLNPQQCKRLCRILETHIPPLLEKPVQFREISLFGDPGNGNRFRLIKRYPLGEVG